LHSWEKGVVNTNPHKKDVSIREELTLSESIDIKVIRGDEILEAHKQLAKLERHFSNDQIQTLKFDEISKTKDRVLTIVFWDICNFSQLSEYLKGNRNLLVEFLQEFYSRVTETIFKNGGSLDKFVGDGAMAIFGIVSRDDKVDAITAVLAALEMRQEFRQLLRKWLAIWRRHIPQKIDIDIRCGIHTGTVTYGNIGTLKNDQLTAVGADVNIASRLETKATPNKIVISTTTESRVRNEFQLKPMGSLDLKNIGGAFTIFEVIGHKQLDS
jgi:adenylate cyclase